MTVEELVRICDVLGVRASQVVQELERRLARLTASDAQVVHGPWGESPEWASDVAARDVDD